MERYYYFYIHNALSDPYRSRLANMYVYVALKVTDCIYIRDVLSTCMYLRLPDWGCPGDVVLAWKDTLQQLRTTQVQP